MALNRPRGAATNRDATAGVARRRGLLGTGAIRLLSVTAVAAATGSLWAGAASAATVAPAAGTATTTTITNASPGTVGAGDPYTFNVTVTGAGGTPTGTVTVAPADPTDLPASYSCTATLTDGAGSCAVTPGAGTFGDIDYEAAYSGDSAFAGSVSTGTHELIVPETTTTSVTPATASPGAVTLTATVVGQAMGDISPSAGGTGSVTFYDGTTVITGCAAASLTYDGGGANLATCTATLAAGTYTITAKYSGDPNNLPSTGTETLTAKYATKTTGSANKKSVVVHHAVRLAATVTSSGSTPSGTVTITWGSEKICSARLSHGSMHCWVKFSKARNYWLRATYSGDAAHSGSRSRLFEVQVKE